MFLFLIKNYLNITPKDIKEFLDNNPGYLDKEKLKSFLELKYKQEKIEKDIYEKILNQLKLI